MYLLSKSQFFTFLLLFTWFFFKIYIPMFEDDHDISAIREGIKIFFEKFPEMY
tara:strand:- start:1528 stop:1686 length:159 start_codon:yes stop_codon:yes gene_type:complete